MRFSDFPTYDPKWGIDIDALDRAPDDDKLGVYEGLITKIREQRSLFSVNADDAITGINDMKALEKALDDKLKKAGVVMHPKAKQKLSKYFLPEDFEDDAAS